MSCSGALLNVSSLLPAIEVGPALLTTHTLALSHPLCIRLCQHFTIYTTFFFCLSSIHVHLVFKSSKVPLQCFMLPLQGLHSGQVLSIVIGGESSVLLMDPRLGLVSVPAAVTWPLHAALTHTQQPVLHSPLGRMYPDLWQSAPSTDN